MTHKGHDIRPATWKRGVATKVCKVIIIEGLCESVLVLHVMHALRLLLFLPRDCDISCALFESYGEGWGGGEMVYIGEGWGRWCREGKGGGGDGVGRERVREDGKGWGKWCTEGKGGERWCREGKGGGDGVERERVGEIV